MNTLFSVSVKPAAAQYNESLRSNGRPRKLSDSAKAQIVGQVLPSDNIYFPNWVSFTARDGWNKRDALNGSFQWKPNDNLSFVTDVAVSRAERPNFDDDFTFPIRYTNDSSPNAKNPTLSNLVIADDGTLVKSLTVQTNQPMGPGKNYADALWNTNSFKQSVDYKNDVIHFTASANYARSTYDDHEIYHSLKFANDPAYDVVFNTPTDSRGGASVTMHGVDIADPKNYSSISYVSQWVNKLRSAEVEDKFDLQVNTPWHLIDYVKGGMRYAKRTYDQDQAWRGASVDIPLSSLPGYTLKPVNSAMQGSDNKFSWMIGDGNSIYSVWDTLRPLIAVDHPEFKNGIYPAFADNAHIRGYESNYAGYLQAHYNLKIVVPVEGIIGARVVNINGRLKSNSFTPDGNGNTITAPITVGSRSLDILPSVNAIAHMTDSLQLRLAWTSEMQRPELGNLNPTISYNIDNPLSPSGSGGNARLQPVSLKKFDASLEWYFGKTGMVSVASWVWNQRGEIYWANAYETVPGFTVPVDISRPYNSGRSYYHGVELQGTTFLSFLPGDFQYIGVSSNFTYYDSKVQYPQYDETLKKMVYYVAPQFWSSKYAFNASVFYEHDKLNARLAYNWRGKRIDSFDATNPYNNLFTDPTKRLDGSINYDVTEHFSMGLEVTNITKEGDKNFWGTHAFPQDITYFARTIAVTARARF